MDSRDSTPQIEVAAGDNGVALIIRHLKPLSEKDTGLWIAFAKEHGFQLYLQPKGPDTVHCIWPEKPELYYEHKAFNTKVHFGPQDFFQVNSSINRQMVPRAVELLQLTGKERVLDLFCGLGNFTLPIARNAAQVTGVEGDSVPDERGVTVVQVQPTTEGGSIAEDVVVPESGRGATDVHPTAVSPTSNI